MSLKLFALDLDGTLLSPDKQISQEDVEAIQEIQRDGHIVMVCSGRAPEDIKAILSKYNLTCPIAGSNGTVVEADNHIISQISMEQNDVISIIQRLNEMVFPYCLYTNNGIYFPDDWSERVKKSIKGLGNTDFHRFIERPQISVHVNVFTDHTKLLLDKHIKVNKLYILTFGPDRRNKLVPFLNDYSNIAVTSSSSINVEIMHKGGHKAVGLKRMAEYYNIPLENTVAIGDNLNDIPMLECAGYSIAMDNADKEVKKICDFVTLSNSESGISHALKQFR